MISVMILYSLILMTVRQSNVPSRPRAVLKHAQSRTLFHTHRTPNCNSRCPSRCCSRNGPPSCVPRPHSADPAHARSQIPCHNHYIPTYHCEDDDRFVVERGKSVMHGVALMQLFRLLTSCSFAHSVAFEDLPRHLVSTRFLPWTRLLEGDQ